MKKLGANLRRIRKEKGLSQGDISRGTGIDRGYLSSLEHGKRNITILSLEKISRFIGIDIGELFK